MLRSLAYVGERHLVRPPCAFHLDAVHFARARPAFRRTQDDHRPGGSGAVAVLAGVRLDVADLVEGAIERRRELLVHLQRVVTGDEVWLPAVADEQVRQILVGAASEHRWCRDLVAVTMGGWDS